jgi:glycosyltransferase involved in cell wall biosynthesis
LKSYLFVTSWSPAAVGGVNEVVLGIARALITRGAFRPIIGVAVWNRTELPDQIRGIPVRPIPMHDAFGEGMTSTLKSVVHSFVDVVELNRFLRANEVAVVNPFFPEIGGLVFVLLRHLGLYRGKLALSFHGADVTAIEQSNSWMKKAWKTYIEQVDAVFSCSKFLEEKLSKIAPGAKSHTVYNGADVEFFDSGRRPHSGPKKILHIGKYEHKKGQDVLLEAFRQLLSRGLDVQLTMIGGTGPTTEPVRHEASKIGDRVRMLTDVPHHCIVQYLRESDLFVLPSRLEPFGIVLIEAGAAGLPVVASRVGGIPELLRHEHNALLVEPGDPSSLAEAMTKLLSDAVLADRLAATWHREAMRFTWEKTADGFLRGLDLMPSSTPRN